MHILRVWLWLRSFWSFWESFIIDFHSMGIYSKLLLTGMSARQWEYIHRCNFYLVWILETKILKAFSLYSTIIPDGNVDWRHKSVLHQSRFYYQYEKLLLSSAFGGPLETLEPFKSELEALRREGAVGIKLRG